MNWVPSGGLPKIRSTDGLSLMPESAASFAWSISSKNLIPLAAISFFSYCPGLLDGSGQT
jgi:hypothetical protein